MMKRLVYAIIWLLIGVSAIMTIPDESAIYVDESLYTTHSADVLSRWERQFYSFYKQYIWRY